MKKLAAGLLTALCTTAFTFAQPYEQVDYTQNAPAATEAPAFVEPQAEQNTVAQQATPAQTNVSAAPANETNAISTTNSNANVDEPMPIDEQPVPVKKTAPIGFGARAAFIYGNFWGFKDLQSDGLEPPTGIGGEFGITARFKMAEGLQFSPEIAFRIFNLSHNEDEDEDGENGIERCYNQMFLDFGLYVRGTFGGSFFLEFAPQISINTSSEYTYDGHKNTFERIEQAAAEFGINVGVGYYILDNLSVNFRWYMGLTEVFPDVKYEGDMNSISEEKSKDKVNWATINLKGAHTMMFKFGVTYWFI